MKIHLQKWFLDNATCIVCMYKYLLLALSLVVLNLDYLAGSDFGRCCLYSFLSNWLLTLLVIWYLGCLHACNNRQVI